MKIVIPINSWQLSKMQVSAAIPYSSMTNTQVVILHAIDPPPISHTRFLNANDDYIEQRTRRAQALITTTEKKLLSYFKPEQIKREIVIKEPARAVMDQANHPEDVVILAQKEKHPLLKAFQSSTCNDMIKKLHCSVVVTKLFRNQPPRLN